MKAGANVDKNALPTIPLASICIVMSEQLSYLLARSNGPVCLKFRSILGDTSNQRGKQ